MDTSLKVIDYIKNVAEYVKTKDGSISASQMLERFPVPTVCPVHGDRKTVRRREKTSVSLKDPDECTECPDPGRADE